MVASCSQLCAATQTPLTRCLLSVSQTDMQLSDTHTHTHIHPHIHPHKVPYAHLYSKAYTPGLRKSPFTKKDGRFSTKAWKHLPSQTHTHAQQGLGVSGEALNCAALLEKWTLFYPLFTCRVLDGWIKPQGLSLCVWPSVCWGWVSWLCVPCVCRVCACVCVFIYVWKHPWACVYCMRAQHRCFSALSHSWKQCTMGDVTLLLSLQHNSPFWLAAKEQWGFRALSCSCQK